jgi:hypothetical protein
MTRQNQQLEEIRQASRLGLLPNYLNPNGPTGAITIGVTASFIASVLFAAMAEWAAAERAGKVKAS